MPYVTSAVRPSTFGGARVRKSAADRPTQPDVGGQWDTCGAGRQWQHGSKREKLLRLFAVRVILDPEFIPRPE